MICYQCFEEAVRTGFNKMHEAKLVHNGESVCDMHASEKIRHAMKIETAMTENSEKFSRGEIGLHDLGVLEIDGKKVWVEGPA